MSPRFALALSLVLLLLPAPTLPLTSSEIALEPALPTALLEVVHDVKSSTTRTQQHTKRVGLVEAARARAGSSAADAAAVTHGAAANARLWYSPAASRSRSSTAAASLLRFKETSTESNPISGSPQYDPPMKVKSMDSRDVPVPVVQGPHWRNVYIGPHRSQPPPPPKPWPRIPGALRYPAPIPYMKPIFRKKFVDTMAQTERYFPGDYTISGGLFNSLEKAPCHVMYKMYKDTCMPPCALKNEDGVCYAKSTTGGCICVDPCTLLNTARFFHRDDYNFGHESAEADCEFCVQHKADKWGPDIGFRGGPRDGREATPPWFRGGAKPQPRWALEGSPYSCGYCGNQCVSGNKHGPVQFVPADDNYQATGGAECVAQWQWKLHDCRGHRMTPEDEAGSEVEVQNVIGGTEVTGSATQEKTDDFKEGTPVS